MSQTGLSLAATKVDDFVFLAEGKSSIVVGYRGVAQPWKGKALRLRKIQKSTPSSTSDLSEAHIVSFQEAVVASILLPKTVCLEFASLPVEPDFLTALSAHVESHRLPLRRAEGGIDPNSKFVVVTEDLTAVTGHGAPRGPTIAIEIKPKWGFLPNPTHLSDESRAVKTRYCRFCIHQHLRKGEIARPQTSYCPLDLYSGDCARITRAIRALYTTWKHSDGSWNQFRIYVDGKITQPSEYVSFERLLRHNETRQTNEDAASLLSEILVPFLLQTPVLARLRLAQSRLDALDIEGLAVLAERQGGQSIETAAQADQPPTLKELTDVARKHMLAEGQTMTFRESALGYALSASVKDCSIFLRLTNNIQSWIPEDIKVIDVDLKSVARLSVWYELDREIWRSASTSLAKPPCIDDHVSGRP